MHPALKDTAGLGILFWLIGYLGGIVLFFTPWRSVMGWILTGIFTPFTIAVTWWWFRERELPLRYYAVVGIAWTIIAVVLDSVFIVLLLGNAAYYQAHVLLYYLLTFLIPVGVGAYLNRAGTTAGAG